MASADYFKAAYPEPWQILGLELKPFSLGHYFKLRRLGCAFVSDKPAGAQLSDLLLAVSVCSMASEPDTAADPFWQWFNRDRAETIGGRLRLWTHNLWRSVFRRRPLTPIEFDFLTWGRKCGDFDISEKIKLFADYLSQHVKVPGFWEDDRQGGTIVGGHWSQSLLHALTSKCGYTMREAYNIPLSKAFADFYKLCEASGGGRLFTEEEEAMLNEQV